MLLPGFFQSSPFDSQAFPHLKEGAFSPNLVYRPADVSDVVEYARLRGVQVRASRATGGRSPSACHLGSQSPRLVLCHSHCRVERRFLWKLTCLATTTHLESGMRWY